MTDVDILIVREPISLRALEPLAKAWHETLVKGVADVRREVLALGGEWHMDANTVLIADGSDQCDVWGFNIYPDERGSSALEFFSLINIRPRQGNKSIELMDESLRTRIRSIIRAYIPDLGL